MTDKELKELIAHNVKLFRVHKDLTQKQLAEILQIDQSYISMVENGRRFPSVKVINKIAGVLEVPVHYMFTQCQTVPDSLVKEVEQCQ